MKTSIQKKIEIHRKIAEILAVTEFVNLKTTESEDYISSPRRYDNNNITVYKIRIKKKSNLKIKNLRQIHELIFGPDISTADCRRR